MRTRTHYVAPGTCAAPARGRGLQGWAASIQQMEFVRETRDVVKGNLKGVEIRSVGAYNNTFAVRKSLKPKFAVIGAHAAIANAAERKSIVDKMHQGVIDHAATKRNSRNNVVLQLWVIRKEVEGQRM